MVRHAFLLLPSLGLAADPPSGVVTDKITYEFDPIGEYCLVPYYGPKDSYVAPVKKITGTSSGTSSMEECAKACTADADCKSWTYVPDAAGDYACYDITATNADAPGSVPLTYDATGKPITGLAGACNCPTAAGVEQTITGANFPAKDTDQYTTLFTNSQHQPAPLGCWPKDKTGDLKLAPAVVQRSNQVAESDPTYFDGWCRGLDKQAAPQPGEDCKSSCQEEPSCSGFQWVPEGQQRPAGCFWGAGYDCDNTDTYSGTTAAPPAAGSPAFDAKAAKDAGMIAERYTRGYVNVVATLKKWRVVGLSFRFDENTFTMQTAATRRLADGATTTVTDWDKTVLRCRQICEADLWCSVWQVYDTTVSTGKGGCYTEAKGQLPYPLDRDQMVEEADGAIKDGAFIQHWYSEDITTTTTTTTSPPPPNRLLPILLGLAGLAALLGLGAYAMGWCSPKEKTKKPRAKRALQPAPEPKEEPKPEPVPTQPTFLMAAPQLTYTAAPVTYAAPVATVQAAPVTYAAPPVTTASYQVVQPTSTVPYSTSVVVPQEPVVGGFMG